MAYLNEYMNIPQMLSTINESKSMSTDITASLTKRIILLGTATDGPLFELMDIKNNTQLAEAVFGSEINMNNTRNGATLMKYYRYLEKSGCNNISLMKITGEPARATLSGKATIVKEQKRKEEVLGTNAGNDETEFVLSAQNVVKDSVTIYARGTTLASGFNVNESKGIITLRKGVTGANFPVSINYDYYKITEHEETKKLDNSSFELDYEPSGDLKISINDIAIDNTKITIDKLNKKLVKIADVTGTEDVKVKYMAVTNDVISTMENSHDGVPFITNNTEKQIFKFTTDAVPGSLHLYANDIELSKSSFVADYVKHEIAMDKKYSNLNAKINTSYLYEVVDNVEKKITFESYFSSDVYNKTKIELKDVLNQEGKSIGKMLIMTKPEEKVRRNEEPLVYSSLQYGTLGELVDAINSDDRQLFKAYANDDEAKVESLTNTTAYCTGGSNGLKPTKKELFQALSGIRDEDGYLLREGAYQLLEGEDAEIIIPCGIYADDELEGKYEDFGYELALACAALSHTSKTVMGGLNTKPCKDISTMGKKAYLEHLNSRNNLYLIRDTDGKIYTDQEGKPTDIGKFLIIGAGEDIETRDSLGKTYIEPIFEIASNLSIRPSSMSITNKIVKASKFRFDIPTPLKDSLVGKRYCMIGKGENGRYKILSGVNVAMPNSKYGLVSTMRSMKEYLNRVRRVSEPFLGGAPSKENTNSLASAISKEIGEMKKEGTIRDASFQLITTSNTINLSKCKIESEILAPEELRTIEHSAGLKN